jgi:NADP-dependent 3-hydroxy acid dehydrogenase YdfG
LESEINIMTTVTQKVAVITGASHGIGAALVQAYRKHG